MFTTIKQVLVTLIQQIVSNINSCLVHDVTKHSINMHTHVHVKKQRHVHRVAIRFCNNFAKHITQCASQVLS